MAARPSTRDRLRDFALALPGAYEDHPWGETVVKVGKKVFVFLGTDGSADPGVGMKLVASQSLAIAQPLVEPLGYNLGPSGWVWVKLEGGPPFEFLRDWVEESYRTIAPKRLVAELDGRRAADGVIGSVPGNPRPL
jgi:predicted DNA-binding protein (MmcQ/YjbR family)